MINLFLFFIITLIFFGGLSLFLNQSRKWLFLLTPVTCSLSSILVLLFIVSKFNTAAASVSRKIFNWEMPFGSFTVGCDGLTAFFMIPLILLSAATLIYGAQYFKDHLPPRTHWLALSLLVSGMIMVLLARNAVLFIIAWEIMSVSSFFLVISQNEESKIIYSGWIYLITAHIGTAFLLATFFLISQSGGSFDFATWNLSGITGQRADLIFIFALVGFGLKAGFIPFHVWLPLAHPAAPSHVSALMSGIMIKMGIYGILRILLNLQPYHEWWGIAIILLGAVAGITGVLFAIGQHDIKRLLAFCSVENIGIILIGIGVGILGTCTKQPVVAMLGFAGALLHVLNHAIFKALLFLGAGAVLRQTKTGTLDELGGLIKKMPWTAYLFLMGAIGISGLPFFNGFISEILIYSGSITGTVSGKGTLFPMMCAVAVISLATLGGLSIACFTRIFGTVFLGTARDKRIFSIGEIPWGMRSGMLLLGFFIIIIGMCSLAVVPFLSKPVVQLVGAHAIAQYNPLIKISTDLSFWLFISLAIICVLFVIRFLFLQRHAVLNAETWGCGYTKPDESMQYTASSFAEPITDTFNVLLDARKDEKFGNELFPVGKWHFQSMVNDWILNNVYIPGVKYSDRLLAMLRWIQCGKAGIYVLYMIATLLGLIIWMFLIWK